MRLPFADDLFGAQSTLFADRLDAGRQLGAALARFRGQRPLVLGIPRGGIPVAVEVARALDGDLDVIVSQKLRCPVCRQLVIGAVTADGTRYVMQDVDRLDVPAEYLDAETKVRQAEAEESERRFRIGMEPLSVAKRTVIVVDDGIAAGSTMIAAALSVRARQPQKLIIAVPVAPRETCEALLAEVDEVVCLESPESFIAIRLHYRDFPEIADADVDRILRAWRSSITGSHELIGAPDCAG